MNIRVFREAFESVLQEVLKDEAKTSIGEPVSRDAHGHEVGRPIEDWLVRILNEYEVGTRSFLSHEFIENVLKAFGFKERQNIDKFFQRPWWASLLVTKMQLTSFLRGEAVPRWQQAGADIVVFLGDDLETEFDKVVLLNVKGHNINRKSRPPNIMSAQRLLYFFNGILQRPASDLDKCNLWFVGTNYSIEGTRAKIEELYLRDLFLLDLEFLPQINFDAAIQLQWHVHDMVERRQTRLDFIESLADKFISEWRNHMNRKNEKYEELVTEIKGLITARR